MEKINYTKMKISELREVAKELNIEGISKLKKQELIDLISEKSKNSEKNEAVNKSANNKNKFDENNNENKNAEKTAEEEIEYSDPVRKTNLMSGVLEIMAEGYGFLRSNNCRLI